MKYLILIAAAILAACSTKEIVEKDINSIARDYVVLTHEIGKFSPDYVDAYFGPDSLKKQAEESKRDLKQIKAALESLAKAASGLAPKGEEAQRLELLKRQLSAASFYVDLLSGAKKTFDEQAKALYGATAPEYSEEHYNAILKQLDSIVPGKGDLYERVENFRKQFYIPSEKLPAVYEAATNEARRITKQYIQLPENEKFTLSYVKDKPWGAYNWFKGNSLSLIEVNTGLPVTIDNALNIAAHEGYPGHHVFHSLTEKHALEHGWVEHTIYPLFSPMSLVSEGLANYAVETVFPGVEALKFQKKVLFPLAGLDTSKADAYSKMSSLLSELSYAGTQADKYYFDKKFTREQAVEFKMKYQLRTRERAERSLDFTDKYGPYVINYNVGLDLVKKYFEKRLAGLGDYKKRWEIYKELITNLKTPEQLQENK